MEPTQLEAVVRAIQLAIAPVFLVTGVVALLSLLAHRLARIIDRARTLERRSEESPEASAEHRSDLEVLARRAKLMNWAIGLGTSCALLVCTVIAALFLSAFLGVGLELLVGWLFIAAMAVLIGALLIFLHEVFLATSRLRIGQRSASAGTQGSSSTSKRPPHTAGLQE
jgi:hypothetical protein